MRCRRILVIAAVLLPLIHAGCGSRVQEPHYYKIVRGMTEREVEDLLGPARSISPEAVGVRVLPGWTV